MKRVSKFLIVFFISLTALSCREKITYDSVLCKIMTNETNITKINYFNDVNQLEFLLDGININGIINGNSITFDNDRFSKKNSIKITNNELLIFFKLDNEDYVICGTTDNTVAKYDLLDNRLKKILPEKRIAFDKKKISNYLLEFSKSNSLAVIESSTIKSKRSYIKDGDLVVIFENYSDNIKKIRSSVYPNKLYEGYFTTILEQKKPFLICMSINDGVASGNKFNDVGFTKGQIGGMYHYADYRDEVKVKDYHFFYYDPYSSKIECSDYGYRTVLEKKHTGNWIVSYEGYYSFISNKWLNELIFSDYIKKYVIPNITQNFEKIGVLENGLPNYKNDNRKILNNLCSNVFADEIEQQYDAKTEKKLNEGKGIKIGKTVITW